MGNSQNTHPIYTDKDRIICHHVSKITQHEMTNFLEEYRLGSHDFAKCANDTSIDVNIMFSNKSEHERQILITIIHDVICNYNKYCHDKRNEYESKIIEIFFDYADICLRQVEDVDMINTKLYRIMNAVLKLHDP